MTTMNPSITIPPGHMLTITVNKDTMLQCSIFALKTWETQFLCDVLQMFTPTYMERDTTGMITNVDPDTLVEWIEGHYRKMLSDNSGRGQGQHPTITELISLEYPRIMETLQMLLSTGTNQEAVWFHQIQYLSVHLIETGLPDLASNFVDYTI